MTPIEELPLSPAEVGYLRRHWKSIEEIEATSDEDFLVKGWMGEKRLASTREAIRRFRAGDSEDWSDYLGRVVAYTDAGGTTRDARLQGVNDEGVARLAVFEYAGHAQPAFSVPYSPESRPNTWRAA